MIEQRTMRRLAMACLLAALTLASLGGTGFAKSDVTVAAKAPTGVSLTLAATGDNDPSLDITSLALEGWVVGSCTAGEMSHAHGPVLLWVESYQVTVRVAGGEDQLLTQGESTVIPAGTSFTVINGMSDPAYPAEIVLLAGTKANPASKTAEPYQPVVKLATSLDRWPAKSFCRKISANAQLQASFKVNGVAGKHGAKLYLGLGVWAPGATTAGYAITDEGASFNLLLLAGGMDNAGYGTGRAFHAGPRQVLKDAYDGQLDHAPFANKGSVPIVGFIFGTAPADGAVFVPQAS